MRILPDDITQIDAQKQRLSETNSSKSKKIFDLLSSKQIVCSNKQFNQKNNNNKQLLQGNSMAQSCQNNNQITQKQQQQNQEKLTNLSLGCKISQKEREKRNSLLVFQEKQQALQENIDKRSSSIEDAQQISNHFNSINKFVKKSFESANSQQKLNQQFQNQGQIANKLKVSQKKRREDNNDQLDKLMDELIKLNQNKQHSSNFNSQKKQKISEQQVNLDNEKSREQELLSLKESKLNQIFINQVQKCEKRSEQQEIIQNTKKLSKEDQDSNLQTRKYQQRDEYQYQIQNNQLQINQQDNLVQHKQLQMNNKKDNNISDLIDQNKKLNNQESSLNHSNSSIQRQNSQNILNQELQRIQYLMLKVNQSFNNKNNQSLDISNKQDQDLTSVANFVSDNCQQSQIVIESNEKIISVASSNEGFCESKLQDANLQNDKDPAITYLLQSQSSLPPQNFDSKEKQSDQQNCTIIQIDSSKSLENNQMEVEKENNKQTMTSSSSLPVQNQMMEEKKNALEIEIKKLNHAIKSLGKKKLSFLKNRERKILKLKKYLIRQKSLIDLQLQEYNTQQLNQIIKQKQEMQQKMLEEILKNQLQQQLNQVQNKKSQIQKSLKKCQFVVLNEIDFDNYIAMEKQKLENQKNIQEEGEEKKKDEQNVNGSNNQENPDLTIPDPISEKKLIIEQSGDINDNQGNQDQQICNLQKQSQVEQDSIDKQQSLELVTANLQKSTSLDVNNNQQCEKSNQNNLQNNSIEQQNEMNLENEIQIEEEEIKSRSFQEENKDQQQNQFNSNQNEQAQSASPISMNQSCSLMDNSSQATPEQEAKYENNNNLNEVNQYPSNTKSSQNSNSYTCDQNSNIQNSCQNVNTEISVQEQQKQNVASDLDKTQIINVEIENNLCEVMEEEEEQEKENQNALPNNEKIHQQQIEIPYFGDEDLFFESKTDKQMKFVQEAIIIDDLFEPENKITKPKGKEQQINLIFKSGQENLNLPNNQSVSEISQDLKVQVIAIDDLFIDRQIGFNMVQENIKNTNQLQKQAKNNPLQEQIQQEQQNITSESKQEMKIRKKTSENFFQTIIALIKTCSYFGLSGYYHTIYKMQEQEIESQKQVQQILGDNQQIQFGKHGKVQTSNQQYTFSFYKHSDNYNDKPNQFIQNQDQQLNKTETLIGNKQIQISQNNKCINQSQPKIITLKKLIIKKKDEQDQLQLNYKDIPSQIKQIDDMDLEQEKIENQNSQKAITNSLPKQIIKLPQPIKHFKIIKK
ncbi:hypothetical protein ABPG72_011390 [Tetrahymena utriculariae]